MNITFENGEQNIGPSVAIGCDSRSSEYLREQDLYDFYEDGYISIHEASHGWSVVLFEGGEDPLDGFTILDTNVCRD